MEDHSPNWVVLLMFAVASISGAVGGVAAGAMNGLRTDKLTAYFVIAYGFIGMVVGAVTYAFSGYFGVADSDVKSQLGWAAAMGLVVPLILAAHNFGARYTFRILGMEVKWSIEKPKDRGADIDISD